MVRFGKLLKKIAILGLVLVVGSFVYDKEIKEKDVALVYHGGSNAVNAYAGSLGNRRIRVNLIDLSTNDLDFYLGLLDDMDGVIFAGGDDFDPAIYGGGDRKLLEGYDFDKDKKDLNLLEAALDKDLPVLGICRGFQLINIHFGGRLYEDLPSQFSKKISHRDGKNNFSRHMIKIEEETRLSSIFGANSYEVNSYHHQGIREVGKGLKVAARAEDGLVEAIENPSYTYLVGIQRHPEADSQDELSKKYSMTF